MIWLNKITYKLKHFLSRIAGKFRLREFSLNSIFIWFVCTGILFVLGFNIYTAFNKGVDTITKFQQEEQKLAALIVENNDLQKQESQYNSLEYKRIYARENLNLADKNETLYYIDRKKAPQQIEQLPEDVMQITLDNNVQWWEKLILGI
jgi:cell division protein FtsB